MSAVVALRPRTTAPTAPALAASTVGALDEPHEITRMCGIQTLQTHCCLFHPFIKTGDVIQVNFNVRRIDCDAEFLVGFAFDDHRWYGARRFQHRLDGQLWIGESDSGMVKWHELSAAQQAQMTVYGRVLEVFKPRREGWTPS